MFGRTAIFSGTNGFGNVAGTWLTNVWTGKSPTDGLWQSFGIGALAPVFSGESFLWGAGGNLVYGEKVANGFSWATGGMGVGAAGLDPSADHGFLSSPPATQGEPSSSNYGDSPAGSPAPLNLGQPSCGGGAPNNSNQSGVASSRCEP